MSGPNHVTGGIVFTGIFSSFFDINIFSDVNFMAITVFASLLPDIDHRKSLIGKIFYPIAKYLDTNYGHRTITHSILFYIIVVTIVYALQSLGGADSHQMTIIFGIALLSHFVFDMVTVAGIPLFYPFFRNPCVIPGSPDARIKSKDAKSEFVIFAIFLFAGVSCYPLMTQGFWMSFNRALGTSAQLISQFKRTDEVLSVDYNFKRNFKEYKGTALVLSATKSEVILFDTLENEFIKIGTEDIVKQYLPSVSRFKNLNEISNELSVGGLSIVEVNKMLDEKKLLKINLYATEKLSFILNETIKVTDNIEESNMNKVQIMDEIIIDSSATVILKNKLESTEKNYRKLIGDNGRKKNEIKRLRRKWIKSNDYQKSVINRKVRKLENQITDINHTAWLGELRVLEAEIKASETTTNIRVYGKFEFINLNQAITFRHLSKK